LEVLFKRARRRPQVKLDSGRHAHMSAQMGSGDIAELVQQMEQSEDDPRRCYALVKQRITEYKQAGNTVPEDLVRMERSLMTECLSQSQGR
jgi:hypothetical protein